MAFEILEATAENKAFKIRGIAMKKNVTSKNDFHYSGKLVESIVSKVSDYIAQNGSYPISMMADHPTSGTNKTLSTIGKITSINIEGNNAVIEAEIANTSVGKDVQELLRGKFVEGLSIRGANAKFQKVNIGGKMVKDVLEMDLKGVDLVVNPGVDGARVTDIIESDQSDSGNLYISISESEEINSKDNIDEEESKLDIKELKLKFPELVESLKAEFKQLFESESQATELQESFDTVSKEKTAIEVKLTESEKTVKAFEASEAVLTTKLEEAEGKLKTIEESNAKVLRDAHIDTALAKLKFAESIKTRLKAKVEVLESTEEIDKVLEAEVDFLNTAISAATGIKLPGKGKTAENETKSAKVLEEEAFIAMVDKL